MDTYFYYFEDASPLAAMNYKPKAVKNFSNKKRKYFKVVNSDDRNSYGETEAYH